MDISLLLLIVGFIVIVYLIFKFIKKIVWAVLSVILLVIVIIAGVFGVVYLDFNYLTSQNDYDIKLIHTDGDTKVLGINIPVTAQKPDLAAVSAISRTDLGQLNPEDIEKDDKIFALVIDRQLFESLFTQDTYSLTEDMGGPLAAFETELSKEDILKIIYSENPREDLAESLVKELGVSGKLADKTQDTIENELLSLEEEKNLGSAEMVFMLALYKTLEDEKNAIKIIDAFKEKELQIYPERLSFKLVRLLPVSTIKGFLPESLGGEPTAEQG